MDDVVDSLFDPYRFYDFLVEEPELSLVAIVLDVLERARLEVVDADDAVTLVEQVVAEVGAEEPGAAGHDGGRHRRAWYSRRPSALPSSADGHGGRPDAAARVARLRYPEHTL